MRLPRPPDGLEGHVSRREAAELLGFGSDFKIRQLEKVGHLRPVRGAMGQAWYLRSQVLELRADVAGPGPPEPLGRAGGRVANPAAKAKGWSDAALIAYLRGNTRPAGPSRGLTVVDLVADTGVSIARAERVYRFWLANDRHPALEVRPMSGAGSPAVPAKDAPVDRLSGVTEAPGTSAPPSARRPSGGDPGNQTGGERRGQTRLLRAALIHQLRDPDPVLRAEAFGKLQQLRVPGKDHT